MLQIILSVAIAAGLLPGAADASRTRPGSASALYDEARTLVAVQGARRLNLACVGTGKTTVVFLSGLGGGSFDWRKVQPAIGKVTRACTYDRAGYGFSDPATAPSDVTNAIADLHALLHSAAVAAPVILVGHSLGGLYATSYALRYRNDVIGMVLVDPAFSGQTAEIAKAVGPVAAARLQAADVGTLASLDACVALAATGRLTLPSEQASECLDNPPDPDPDIHRQRNRQAKSTAFQRALRSEFAMASIVGSDGATADDRQSTRHDAALGAMPLAILTRGNSEAIPGLSADEIASAEAAWRAGHDKVARLSAVGANSIVLRSGHYIQIDQPAAVVGKIRDIINRSTKIQADKRVG